MQQKKNIYFFAVCPRRLLLIPFFCICLFLQNAQAAEPLRLIPVGKTVGVTLDTDGLLVLGTGEVSNEKHEIMMPGKALRAGDRILKANGQEMENKEALQNAVESSNGKPMTLLYERNGAEKQVEITPVFSTVDQTYKIGVWIRDSIQGIGTVTYFDPKNHTFGALGHGVYDVDTDGLMVIRDGALAQAELTEIIRGQKGSAGELTGKVDLDERIAKIEKNTETGIFGATSSSVFAGEALLVAQRGEVRKGAAVILSDLEGGDVKEYSIKIESIQKGNTKSHKDMTIRITDEHLLKLTGGIVQGMSGAPIIQDGKLVGAVTHVMVNDPTRGYGVLIENMLQAAA